MGNSNVCCGGHEESFENSKSIEFQSRRSNQSREAKHRKVNTVVHFRSEAELIPSKMNQKNDAVSKLERKNPLISIHGKALAPASRVLGPFRLEDGSTYEGEMRDGLREGFGKQVYKNGSVYEGFWLNDKPHGVGRKIFENNHVYIGDWKNGLCEGEGTYSDLNKQIIYTGGWRDGQKNGHGSETYKDKSSYIGDFVNSQKHGLGKFTWPDGSFYEGDFIYDTIEGIGTHSNHLTNRVFYLVGWQKV